MEVWDGPRLVDIGPRMPRAVLAMLLLDANRVVSQDRLIDGLWGEDPPAQPTGTLQVYISNLRRVLEPERGRGKSPRVLVTRAPGYVLQVDAGALDAARFEAAVIEGRALWTAGQPGPTREVLRRALSWWRGAPYSDVGLEAYFQAEVARLTELRAGAAEASMEAELAAGGHAGLIGELEALVQEEPLRERRWELFALALYRCGRQADALRAIAKVRAILQEELGLEPGVALRQLEHDILRQARSLDAPQPRAAKVATARPATEAATALLPGADPGWPLVGRTAELAALEHMLAQSRAGRSGVVLMAGEPGVGKTRLATELARRATDRGVAVAWGRCFEGDAAPAFWPWTQVLRALLGDLDAETLRSRMGSSAAALGLVVPELGEPFPETVGDAAAGYDPEKARLHLYTTVCRVVESLVRGRPLLVVLDDLHWADPASLQLLGFAAAQLVGLRVLIVGTYRDTEVDSSHPLGATLAELVRQGATRVALGGLDRVQVGEFVTTATGSVPDDALVARVWDRTNGNPFFVDQLVRLVESRGGVAEVLATEVPGGVRDVILHRVGLLPEGTGQVLRLAAVVGRDFEMDVLARVANGDEEHLLDRVETALRSGLVVEQPETVGRYHFVHALVRETLYDDLSALRRAKLHRRIGEVLEQRGGTDPLELAHHFWQAEPAGTAEKALEHAIRAADHAMARLAYEQAEEQLRRTLELAARLPEGADRSRLELELQTRLWLLLAPLHGYAHPEAGRIARRARELCRELGDPTQLVRPLWRLWAFHNVRAEFQPAQEYGRELLEASGNAADPLFLMGAHHALGMVGVHRGQLALARHHLETAVLIPAGDDWLTIDVFGHHGPAVLHSCLAVVQALLGEEAAARHSIEVGTAIAREVGHPFTSAMTTFFEAWVAAHLRDLPLARRAGKAGGAACEEGQFRMWGAAAKIIGGWARALQGEGAAGFAEASEALAQWEQTGARMLRSYFLGLLGEAQRTAGKPQPALDIIDQALILSQSIGEHFYDAELHRLRGELLATQARRTAEAEAALRQAVAVAEAQGARLPAQLARESLQRLLSRV